MQQTHSKYKK